MDTRTGDLYANRQDALDAGVPEEFVKEADVEETGDIVTITSGPFKGRQYIRRSDGSLGRRIMKQESRDVVAV